MNPLTFLYCCGVHSFPHSAGLFLLLIILTTRPMPAFSQGEKLLELKATLQTTKDDSLRIQQLLHLSRKIHQHNHQEKEEYQYAREAIDLSLKINDTLLYARSLDNLGLLYRYHEWYAQAIPLHIKAFQLVNKKNIKPIYKMIFANNTGVAARYNQQYAISVEYYLKALKIAVQNSNLKNVAISSNGLGNALSNIPGKDDEALSYFMRALAAERQLNDSLGIAMDLLSIGGYYIENKHYEKARHYLDTLHRINKNRKDTFGLAITNEFYGHSYFKENKQLDKAKIYYLRSLHQFKKLSNTTKVADLLNSLGGLQSKLGNPDAALHLYLQSLELADSIQNKALIVENAYHISGIKEKQSIYSEALYYYQMAKSFEDSIALDRQKIKIAALTNQYMLDKKEVRIASLQEENRLRKEMINLQKQKILTHKIYFIILIASILFILLFIFLQYKNRKIKKHTQLLLQKNHEELLKAKYEKSIAQAEMLAARTQLNPHFLFNSLNAIHLLIQKKQTKRADEYLIKLSRFTRMVLELPKSQAISLEEELNLIQYYIALEEKRFNNDFDFQLNALTDKDMENIQIPPLLLQPFVENAIWHGLLPSEKDKKLLSINIKREMSDIHISIKDNGVGRNRRETASYNKNHKKSMGMKITQERIVQFNKSYNCKIDLNMIDGYDEKGTRSGTEVILTIKNCVHSVALNNLNLNLQE